MRHFNEFLHIMISMGVFCIAAFLCLGLKLGKKHQITVSAFVVTSLNLVLFGYNPLYYTGGVIKMLIGSAIYLAVYMFLCAYGISILERILESLALRDEEGNIIHDFSDEYEEVVIHIDTDKASKKIYPFLLGVNTILLLFACMHLVLASWAYPLLFGVALGTLLIVLLWRIPRAEK